MQTNLLHAWFNIRISTDANTIVLDAVVTDALHVLEELLGGVVVVLGHVLAHGLQVHGVLDDLVVVPHLLLVDGGVERPRLVTKCSRRI